MKILAFDTCLDKMYVALGEDDKILSSKVVETTKSHYHSAFLISNIANILKENNLTPQDIDLIATNIGPGSFTGIRACTTVARVMAQACNTKVVGVSSLEILSRVKKERGKEGKRESYDFALQNYDNSSLTSPSHLLTFSPTLVALDARKNMAYYAIFEDGKEISSPQTILIENLQKMIDENDYFVITDKVLQPTIGGVSYQSQDDDLGIFLIQIAQEKASIQDYNFDWKKLKPLYIQPPALHMKKA